MPKIIENLPLRLAQVAKKQVMEAGYSALTVRSVAAACGVGTGTVYNYYPSKDALVAAFMLEDWKKRISAIADCGETAPDRETVLRLIHENLQQFLLQYETVFRDETAAPAFSGAFSRYHGLLRKQLSAPIRRFCSSDFAADFIAEAMLTWTVEGKSFDDLKEILQCIL